jgi:hypothetical protein
MWAFAVGHFLGPFYGGSEVAPGYRIRIGTRVVTLLSDRELAVWMLAHGLPDALGSGWTRDSVLDVLGRDADGAEVLDLLVDTGVVVVVPPARRISSYAGTSCGRCCWGSECGRRPRCTASV